MFIRGVDCFTRAEDSERQVLVVVLLVVAATKLGQSNLRLSLGSCPHVIEITLPADEDHSVERRDGGRDDEAQHDSQARGSK